MTLAVMVTGASGYLGAKLVRRLARRADLRVVATDLRPPGSELPRGVVFEPADIRDPELRSVLGRHGIGAVAHLAAVVDPSKDRQLAFSVDVGGTENLLQGCLEHGVRRVVVASSGAAYGYLADHPRWITEDRPLLADQVFAYAWHKRLVEERLAELRRQRPELEQVIFRISTILGEGVDNAITQLFERPRLLGLTDGDDRFVFVWDEDVAACFERAITVGPPGIFNLAAEGALGLDQLAARMGKRVRRLPAGWLTAVLRLAHPLGLLPWGPEQVRFLRYRPVLSNRRLVEDFGYRPEKTSAEVFELFLEGRARKARGS